MENKTLLRIEHLKKTFGDHTILKDISMEVKKGEVIVIIGPSGCGKSTFLRCLNHLETIDGGAVYFKDECISGKNISRAVICQHIGMVFQSYDLFNHLTVIDNITLAAIQVQHRKKAEVEQAARRLLARVGLADKETAYPRQLSGGQKQRIAMIRALILNPEVMLFDEVTASLDPEMVREVLDVIIGLTRQGMTMLIVTHEMSFARAVADRIFFFDDGQIIEENVPERFFDKPGTERAGQFLNSFKFNSVKVK
ncbi:amino acid ABC transporter ATP-binding protein [Pectinatus haikarae]|uniref:Polar amino acid transport system ATP-binding protein n=1 Tax=Pectinatus haikarae TaxID=349096 RepID=A0ABT9Y7C1_9FIRM|nr:amino acid ABC transporter ATP-binding protein [Pectinatus haikarae]MDQ0203606.1 polar amino acid transport system ATP-binding protein [Pectinatus haikarae]